MTEESYPDALPVGYRLHWYVLERVLGQGGFGITYLARDSNLDRQVAIKEYLPTDIARRRSDASARPHTEAHAERFGWGLERFLSEARTLARFDHANIVRVYSVFEANNTAYMVMRFEQGENLATLLERRGTLTERQLTDCLLPILDGLERVHAGGYIHRDIKPENIYVRQDGSPVLLDFGAARQSFGSAKTMTVLVAPGYAPLEQYYGDAETQGPWTDIYGLGATCYRVIAGRAPIDAVARAKGVLGSIREILQPAVEVGRGRYSPHLLEAVDHALALSECDRPQSIADWRREIVAPVLDARPDTTEPVAPATAVVPDLPVAPAQGSSVKPHPNNAAAEPVTAVPVWRQPLLWGAVATLGALGAVASFRFATTTPVPAPAPAPAPAPQSAITVVPVPAALPMPPPAPTPAQVAVPEVAPVPATAAAPAPAASLAAAPATVPVPRAQDKIAVGAPRISVPKPVTITPRATNSPAPRETREAVLTHTDAAPSRPAVVPESTDTSLQTTPAPALVSTLAAPQVVSAPMAAQGPNRDVPATRSARDDQLAAGEAALRRGDDAAAAEILAPLAEAGVPRAQALLGRAQEQRLGRQQSDFEAYVWYSIAARNGEPGALARRDKVALKLQPAEIRQAEQVVKRWKPRTEAAASASH